MNINISIKLDRKKIRVYLTSDDETLNKIREYLKEKEYQCVTDCITTESEKQQKKSTGYSLDSYSMAYTSHKERIKIETWFSLQATFTDDTLASAIEQLVKPLVSVIEENVECSVPNFSILDLEDRKYHTVFEQKDATLTNVLEVVRLLESLVQTVRMAVGLEEKIPSKVCVTFDGDRVPNAVYSNGLAVFGLLSAPLTSGDVTRSIPSNFSWSR